MFTLLQAKEALCGFSESAPVYTKADLEIKVRLATCERDTSLCFGVKLGGSRLDRVDLETALYKKTSVHVRAGKRDKGCSL